MIIIGVRARNYSDGNKVVHLFACVNDNLNIRRERVVYVNFMQLKLNSRSKFRLCSPVLVATYRTFLRLKPELFVLLAAAARSDTVWPGK